MSPVEKLLCLRSLRALEFKPYRCVCVWLDPAKPEDGRVEEKPMEIGG